MKSNLINLDETFQRCEFNHGEDYVLTVYFTSGLYLTARMNKSMIAESVSPHLFGVSIMCHNNNVQTVLLDCDMDMVTVAETLAAQLKHKQVTTVSATCHTEFAQLAFCGEGEGVMVEFNFFYNHSGYDAVPVMVEQRHCLDNSSRLILLKGNL